MRRGFLTSLAVLIIAMSSQVLPAAAQRGNAVPPGGISGRVIIPLGNFQDMFQVTLVQNAETPLQTVVADAQGRYRFTGLQRGTYYVLIKIEGFQEVRQRVDVNNFEVVQNIILDFQEERIVKPRTDLSGEELGIIDISELNRSYPQRITDLLKTAEKDFHAANYNKALLELEEVVRDVPDLYAAQRMLGMAYQKLARYRDAESAYRTASELRPTSAAPLINLGSLYVEEAQASEGKGSAVVRGILNESLANLDAALKIKPDAPFAYYLLGVTYYKTAFYEDAEDNLKRSLELAPDLSDARLALANVYVKMQEWSNVIGQLDAYLMENPRSPIREQVQNMRSRVVARSQASLR
jgi:Tfp pilus assembly protein PilF